MLRNVLSLVTFNDTFNKLVTNRVFAAPKQTNKGEFMTRSTTIPTFFTVFSMLCSIPATVLSQQKGPFFFSFEGGGYHQSEADLSDADGGFSKDRWFLSAGLQLFGKLKLKDADGIVIDESKYDPSLIAGGTFEFRI